MLSITPQTTQVTSTTYIYPNAYEIGRKMRLQLYRQFRISGYLDDDDVPTANASRGKKPKAHPKSPMKANPKPHGR